MSDYEKDLFFPDNKGTNPKFFELNPYNRPITCEKCGGIMVFVGVGEYHCEDCKFVAYDDYGKVRNYIEEHKGANILMVAANTGVSKRQIRNLLRQERIELVEEGLPILRCELCRTPIRSGILCKKCTIENNRLMENRERQKQKALRGIGMGNSEGAEGEMRFNHR